jgi:hypothetical protein
MEPAMVVAIDEKILIRLNAYFEKRAYLKRQWKNTQNSHNKQHAFLLLLYFLNKKHT